MLAAEPKAERLITLTKTFIIPEFTKTEPNNCFIVHCFKENNDASHGAQFDIALKNHALRAQPTD